MSTERTGINVLLRNEQSGGRLAVMDNVVPAGFPGPPLHHHGFDETFYVLDGELTFQLEDEIFTRRQGELAFAPRDVAHTFANLSGADARTLIICTPAGFERYFDRLAAEPTGVEPPQGLQADTGDDRSRSAHRRAVIHVPWLVPASPRR